MKQIAVLIAASALLAGCMATAAPPSPQAEAKYPEPLPASEMRDLTPAEKAILAKGFAAGLKDPGSAQFQWAKIQKALPADGGMNYCAQVNAKNSYGGYIGMTPFMGVIQIKNGKIVGGEMGAVGYTERQYADLLPKMCREKGLNPYG